jgi:hypothetical protein
VDGSAKGTVWWCGQTEGCGWAALVACERGSAAGKMRRKLQHGGGVADWASFGGTIRTAWPQKALRRHVGWLFQLPSTHESQRNPIRKTR